MCWATGEITVQSFRLLVYREYAIQKIELYAPVTFVRLNSSTMLCLHLRGHTAILLSSKTNDQSHQTTWQNDLKVVASSESCRYPSQDCADDQPEQETDWQRVKLLREKADRYSCDYSFY